MKTDPRRVWQRFLRRLKNAASDKPTRLQQQTKPRLIPVHLHGTMAELVDIQTRDSREYRLKQSNAMMNTDGTHPAIVFFTKKLIEELQRLGYPFYPFQFLRTGEEQDRLYARGVTKAKAGQSPHNHGLAVDVIHYKKLWDLTPRQWELVGEIGKEVARKANIPIEWGGDWTFYDPAHWQLAGWRSHAPNRPDAGWPRFDGPAKQQRILQYLRNQSRS